MLKGKCGFITGGSSGIGKASAKAMLKYGAKVTVMHRRTGEDLEALKNELGDNCYFVYGDVVNPEDVEKAVAYAKEQMGRLDFAVNSAGSATLGKFHELTDETFDETMKTCLYGTFYSMREESKLMVEQGSGSIINISSINSTVPAPMFTPYCTAKAGVDMLTKSAAIELGKYNIKVNAICPGFIDTPLIHPLLEMDEINETVKKGSPMGRVGEPEEIAEMCAFLASDKCGYINGVCIAIDSGMQLMAYPSFIKYIMGEDD